MNLIIIIRKRKRKNKKKKKKKHTDMRKEDDKGIYSLYDMTMGAAIDMKKG